MFYLLILLLQMKLIRQINDLNKAIKDNYDLGFVPTMGGLHKGHESLIRISKKNCKKTLVSIFVNPKQFDNISDYKSYPINLDRDLNILKKMKVDLVFIPNVNQIYKDKKKSKFKLKNSQKILCAKFRKGHFEGVLDVMNRLINIILPKIIYMGEKDFQQHYLVKNYFEKIYKCKIISCKTIRDKNKVALSSRNFLLNKRNNNIAGTISRKLIKLKKKISHNKDNFKNLILNFKEYLTRKFDIKIEYLEVRDIKNLKKNIISKKFKLFIAYYLNGIRLIDNF